MRYKQADHSLGQDRVLLQMFNEANKEVLPLPLNIDDVVITYVGTDEKWVSSAEIAIQAGHRLYKDEIITFTYNKAELKNIQKIPLLPEHKLTKRLTTSSDLVHYINKTYSINITPDDLVNAVFDTNVLFPIVKSNMIEVTFSDTCMLYKGTIQIRVTATERLLDEAMGVVLPQLTANDVNLSHFIALNRTEDNDIHILWHDEATHTVDTDSYNFEDYSIKYMVIHYIPNRYYSELEDAILTLEIDKEKFTIPILSVFIDEEDDNEIVIELAEFPIDILHSRVPLTIEINSTIKKLTTFTDHKVVKLPDIIDKYHIMKVPNLGDNLSPLYNDNPVTELDSLVIVSELAYAKDGEGLPDTSPVYWSDCKFRTFNEEEKIICGFNIYSLSHLTPAPEGYTVTFYDRENETRKICDAYVMGGDGDNTEIYLRFEGFDRVDLSEFGDEVDVYLTRLEQYDEESPLLMRFSKIVLQVTNLSKFPLIKHGLENIGSVSPIYPKPEGFQALNGRSIEPPELNLLGKK